MLQMRSSEDERLSDFDLPSFLFGSYSHPLGLFSPLPPKSPCMSYEFLSQLLATLTSPVYSPPLTPRLWAAPEEPMWVCAAGGEEKLGAYGAPEMFLFFYLFIQITS